MKRFAYQLPCSVFLSMLVLSCSTAKSSDDQNVRFTPSAVIDLGALVTEELPQHFWGKAFLKQMNFTRQNSFDVIRWTFPMEGGSVSGSNAYYTLFNHGGPHVDAPNVYEQLLNVDKLLGKEKMFFVGVPLNIKGGDGMTVRPVVFVY